MSISFFGDNSILLLFWNPLNTNILHCVCQFHIIEAAKERQIAEGVSSNGYIFSMKDVPVSVTSLRKPFYKYSEKIGIPSKSSHKARKTYVSALIDANVNINTIRELVGHKDEKTTFNNYCYNRATTDEIINQIGKALS